MASARLWLHSNRGVALQAAAPAFQIGWALRYATANVGAGLMFAVANAALPLYLASYGLPNAAIGLLAQNRAPLAGISQVVGRRAKRPHANTNRPSQTLPIGRLTNGRRCLVAPVDATTSVVGNCRPGGNDNLARRHVRSIPGIAGGP